MSLNLSRERIERIGWIVFLASAVCFTWAGFRSGDLLSTVGSLLFFVACFFFIAPGSSRPDSGPERQEVSRY